MSLLKSNIDLSELAKEFNLVDSQIFTLGSLIIDSIIEEYKFRWNNLIQNELRSTRTDYNKGVFIDRDSPLTVTFGLTARESPLALMIEEGASPFDMKQGFQKSKKVKQKLDGGWYITVPFRHATPEAVASSGFFASIMPPDIYSLVKNSSKPLLREQLPLQYRNLAVRPEIKFGNTTIPSYLHKSPIYEGLVKINTGTNGSQYMTFRRASDKSDPNSWWHKGILPKKLMDRALEAAQINRIVDMVTSEFLNNL